MITESQPLVGAEVFENYLTTLSGFRIATEPKSYDNRDDTAC
jgi:hypothetical protein